MLSKAAFSRKYPILEGELLDLGYSHYLENNGVFNITSFLKQFKN